MFNLPKTLFSKDWVNLNPRTDPNAIDLYYNERLNIFSLSPIFTKSALPEVYDLFARNFKLKLKLPFLASHPDFERECAKLNLIERKLEKPKELEDYADSDVFMKRLTLVLDENYIQESLKDRDCGRTQETFSRKRLINTLAPKDKRDHEEASTVEHETAPVMKAYNFKENTLKLRRKSEKCTKAKQIAASIPVMPLASCLHKFKDHLCGNNQLEDFQKWRIEDSNALRNFLVLNKNDVALFYEIFQRVHKIKPVFDFVTSTEKKNLGTLTLTLDGKPMLQTLDNSRRDAKNVICGIALEIFCPVIKNYQMTMKRKCSQVKGLVDTNMKPKMKKIKGSKGENSQHSEENGNKAMEKIKDPAEFMKGFENINRILGKTNEGEHNNIESKDPLETLDNNQIFEDDDDPFNLFMREIYRENTYDQNVGLFEKEPAEVRNNQSFNMINYENQQNGKVAQKLNINNLFSNLNMNTQSTNSGLQGQQNIMNNNAQKFVNNQNSIPYQIPKKNNIMASEKSPPLQPSQIQRNFLKNPPTMSNNPRVMNNFEKAKPLEEKDPKKIRKAKDGERISDKTALQEERVAPHDPTKEEEDLEEELKRICGKRVISIDDLLKDMGSSQKNYSITSAIEFLEKLLKLYSLKHSEINKIFIFKEKEYIRVSIKCNDKAEVCFVRNESPSLSKYFCLLEFFKKKYGPRSTVNEILVKLVKKNNQKPSLMTTSTLNKPTRDEKIPSSEVRGLLDDIDNFQYSRNTINNKRNDETFEDGFDDNDLEDELSKKKKTIENKKKSQEIKINRKESLHEENRTHSSSHRDKINREAEKIMDGKQQKDVIDPSEENDIIFIE